MQSETYRKMKDVTGDCWEERYILRHSTTLLISCGVNVEFHFYQLPKNKCVVAAVLGRYLALQEIICKCL